MIPVVILIALIAGLFRAHWVAIPIAASLWVALLMVGGDPTASRVELAVGGSLLGLLNAVPGYGLGHGIRTMVVRVKTDVSEHLTASRGSESDSSKPEARN